jgi:hypothetical protein
VWSLSLVCGTQAHKTFYLVESSFNNHLHHFSSSLQNTLKFFFQWFFISVYNIVLLSTYFKWLGLFTFFLFSRIYLVC